MKSRILILQESMNITLPEWATKDVQRKMDSLVKLEYDIQSHNTVMKRLNGGFLVKEFIKNMDAKKTRSSPKLYVYSGHEVNVAAFAKAHDLTKPEMPFFGSAIIVEKLRNCAGKQFVRVRFIKLCNTKISFKTDEINYSNYSTFSVTYIYIRSNVINFCR